MMPIPPSCAIAIAIFDSVTVSIFALMSGIFSEIFLDNFVFKSVCDLEIIGDRFGIRRTSSKVKPSFTSNISLFFISALGL